jgi:formyl-CoA transferase
LDDEFLFAGLRVLDVGSWIAAPVATTILADYGADVLKVEVPGGDAYRAFADGRATPDADVNYAWELDNRNKRSITLNLKNERARKILRELVAECDVYATNLPQNLRRDWGLTYEELHPLNSRMIYASLTAYGEEGPERDREGFDLVAYWSRSGLMDLVRARGAPPAPAIPGMGDHPTALALYGAIVTALLKRERTGKGSHVHTSLLANGMWSASCIAQAAFAEADFSHYRTVQGFTRVMYETKDHRWLQFTMVRSVEELDLLFTVLGLAHLLADERFATIESRLAHGAELVDAVAPVIMQRDAAEWLDDLQAVDVPVALVGEVGHLPRDEQVQVNDMVMPTGMPSMPQVIKHPLNVKGLARKPFSAAPGAGAHTDEVLAELGYDAKAVAALRAEEAI